MAFNPFDPFSAFKNNFFDGYQFGDLTKSVMGIHNDQSSGIGGFEGSFGDPLSQLGNLITGQTDFARNMELAAEENRMNRENMQIQNAFTAEREDLAYERNRQDALDARLWDQAQSDTAITRQMKDLKNAGLNPYMAAGGSGASSTGMQLPGANSASSASVPAIRLPESKIWANTSDTFKTTLSNLLSLAMVSKFLA